MIVHREWKRDSNSREQSSQHKVTKIYKRKVAVLGPRTCAWAEKLEKGLRCAIDAAEAPVEEEKVQPQCPREEDKKLRLTGEMLYGVKGKRSRLTINICDNEPCICDHLDTHMRQEAMDNTRIVEIEPFAGLKQPRLLGTDTIVCRENKTLLRCKNKHQQQAMQIEQPVVSPWTQYQGRMEAVNPTDHTACPPPSQLYVPCRACASTSGS
jgi:hypothetical protein